MTHLETLRHSTAHLMAAAILELWPNTKLGIGPSIENGFYYDLDLDYNIHEEDLKKIEKKMKELAHNKNDFIKETISKEKARELLKDQPLKLKLIEDIPDKEVSIYKTGNFIDLCKGPHVENTREIKAFKLLKISGAYWKGDSKNKQLQRIYGTAFETKEELNRYLQLLEEAKKRDHKLIGEKQDLYMLSDLIGKGLPIWLPKGEILKEEIEKFAIETEKKAGYVRVSTPHLAKEELFIKSGHLPHYEKSMYPKMIMDDGTYYLKAMNCPLHHIIYNRGLKSYRELPLRIAEYGTVYRNELSGALSGLLRVRMLSMNDAHIYCTKNQIGQEIKAVIEMIENYYKTFGFKDYYYRLSLWDSKNLDKYIDEPENWDYAENELRKALKELNVNYKEVIDEAAFYGPKIDIQFKTITGREETMSTVQLDFAAKSRFKLQYMDEHGEYNNEVFVIHRAPLSTHERFIAFLIEHCAGKFPTWLAPTQIALITVADRHNDFAKKLVQELKEKDIRVELDERSESISKKVRDHQQTKVPYIITIGDKEIESGNLAFRTRDNKISSLSKEKFIKMILNEIEDKSL